MKTKEVKEYKSKRVQEFRSFILLYFCTFVLLYPALSDAATYYADSGCGNITIYDPATRACTGGSATSRTTIQAAVNLATTAGDIVDIREGTYAEHITFYTYSGASGNPITYRGHAGETVIIQPPTNSGIDVLGGISWLVFNNLKVNGRDLGSPDPAPSPLGMNSIVAGGSNLVFDNIESYDNARANPTYGPAVGAKVDGANVTFRNCYMHHNGAYSNPYHANGNQGGQGFYWAGNNGTIDNCRIEDNGAFGIQVYSFSGPPSGVTIKNSIWARNGAKWYDSAGNPDRTSAAILSYASSSVIFNNVIYDSPLQMGISVSGSSSSVVGNTVYNNWGGIEWWNGITPSISNNLLMNNASQGNFVNSGGSPTFSNNFCFGTGGTSNCQITGKDPLFISAGTGDFRLSIGSSAIDAGSPLSSPYNTDITGASRPLGSGWDVGAYEYATPTQVVTNQLVLALPLDEGTGGIAVDVSGQKNNANLIGGATWDNVGVYGKAVLLDGTGYLNVAPSQSLALPAMTLESWIYPTVTPTGFTTVIRQARYFLYASSDAGYCPAIALAPVGGYAGLANNYVCATSMPPLNQWSHLAVTYDGSTMTFYLNGNIIASQGSADPMVPSTYNVTIGASQFGENFVGKIDQPMVYNYARTRPQILSDMSTPLIGAPGKYVEIAAPVSVEISAAASLEISAD